ncbi:MAG: hypothetical protein HYR85_11615 [Planctomycetes bacterium]|nr:hypothetical protein [Planctomycetota bacterium]MBI3845452.1 hypothetical protein [Planctomycetota bacterium]
MKATLSPDDPMTRLFLRHALATLAYRAGKTVRGTSEAFGSFRATPDSRTTVEILAHMGDLMDWALRMVKGNPEWTTATPLPWEKEIARFFASVKALDDHLASGAPIRFDPGRVFQGGIADALTHTGQLAMLRRLSGFKMKGESYAKADIAVGRVGLDQTPPDPKVEFD